MKGIVKTAINNILKNFKIFILTIIPYKYTKCIHSVRIQYFQLKKDVYKPYLISKATVFTRDVCWLLIFSFSVNLSASVPSKTSFTFLTTP